MNKKENDKQERMFSLYDRLTAEGYTQKMVAECLKVPNSRITMWLEQGEIPDYFEGDMMRMLGEDGIICDQFYTSPEIAKYCMEQTWRTLDKLEINPNGDADGRYTFIEPSAGAGAFYDLLPDPKIGLDLEPNHPEVIRADYLNWQVPSQENDNETGKYMVIGNPPFGYRGHLALQFINRSVEFADITAFILPQSFESDGKGMPGKRVDKTYKLAHTERLESDRFHSPDGKHVSVRAIFQVWTAINHHLCPEPEVKPTCSQFIKIYSLSDGPKRMNKRNVHMFDKCDLYLPSTCFEGMQCYEDWEDLPNKRGYGIVIHAPNQGDKDEIKELLMGYDWVGHAYPSTNSALNIRTSVIENALTENGWIDK